MKKTRPSIHEYLMSIAREAAKRSTCTSHHPTGAVAAISGRVVMTGYNGVPSGMQHCDDAGCVRMSDGKHAYLLHAEENLVAQAARYQIKLLGVTVYCTHQPCPHCAAMLVQAGVACVVYDEAETDSLEKESYSSVVMAIGGVETVSLKSLGGEG